ncbi:MAG: M23 family metallopeptidase [Bacteroidetes bacterium]|nr:MAG: M23 family metallopeptidase [Bacteroidota bacterium]
MIIRDEENFEEKRKINYTPAQVGSIFFLFFLVVFVAGFGVASLVYSGTTAVGEDAMMRRKLVKQDQDIETLVAEMKKRDAYLESLRKTIGGEVEKQDIKAPKDTLKKVAKSEKSPKDTINIDVLSEADVRLREEMETRSANTPTTFSTNKGEQLKDMYFFSPVKGIVSNKYDSRTGHLGVDIVSDKDAPLKAIYDGTVIMASWTDETGYVITIQHQSDLLSVYKHCSVLLKKQGDFVRAGEIVAIIGNSGELTTGPHLHFELWYKGNPINPEGLIALAISAPIESPRS